MPTLTIKRVPEELRERLKKQAERHRRSMNNEVITILEQALMPWRRSAEGAVARAEALDREVGKTFDLCISKEASERDAHDRR